jgi:predicted DNA-binding transcriptional regulator AlpA
MSSLNIPVNPKSAKTPIAASIPAEKPAPTIPSFDTLPDSGYIREAQLVRSPKRPDTPAPLPFSAPTLWRKVKDGTFPKPIKLGSRVTAWQVGTIRAWMAAQAMA